jgi:glycosyltransferase involved in cell wall biosynthesis
VADQYQATADTDQPRSAEAGGETTRRVAVSLATYNRPSGLQRVLDGIEAQDVPHNLGVRVIVVDNSGDANARHYAEQRAADYRWPLLYRHEARRGISYARNTGLEAVIDSGDPYVLFIDDDERPHEAWIAELVKVAEETGADAVFGAIQAKFERPPPWWIIEGGFLDTLDFVDRAPVPHCYTSNALVRTGVIREQQLRFDASYALTGGEDTLFFKKFRDGGGRTAFARHALTYEYIVPSRATLAHLVKFWYRTGNTDAIIRLGPDTATGQPRHRIVVHGLARIVGGLGGTLLTLPTLLIRRVHPFDFLRTAMRGFGYLAAAFGVKFEEYRHHKR